MGDSSGSDLLAYWQQTDGFGCPSGELEIRTYDFSSGSVVLTDDVAFVATMFKRPVGVSVSSFSGSGAESGTDNAN